ncbi:MAG: rod-binding protein [Planctomycetota bacterium]
MQLNVAHHSDLRSLRPETQSRRQQVESARELQDVYREFVGKTFFGQLLKSMRTTVGKPAYFHGGQTEEVFRSQLDQTLAEEMTNASADKIADPMFRIQFPRQARLLDETVASDHPTLADLNRLRRW